MALSCISGCQECDGCMMCQEHDEKPIKVCDCCGNGIYEGNRYYEIDDVIYCEECIDEFKHIA